MRLGIVRAVGVRPHFSSTDFDQQLNLLVAKRAEGLSSELDAVRRSSRDMLRNGTYKPTGRGKPASEYLLRAASGAESFPRINWMVDACNYISLMSLLPVSIWDLEKTGSRRFVFRLGRDEESYAFNTAGQVISVKDLVVGSEITLDHADGNPIVNPVKDSMKTKTSDNTREVAAAIYSANDYPVEKLEELCASFAELLRRSADPLADAHHAVVESGDEVTL